MLPIVFVGEFLFSLHPFLYFLYVLYLLISLNLLSSLQLQTFPTPFPAFPRQTPLFIQKPSPIKVNPSKYPLFSPKIIKNPTFYPPKPPKLTFSLKKPSNPPIFSDFPYFFIQNSGFSSHLTPAALIPYFSLFFPIFRKSSKSERTR